MLTMGQHQGFWARPVTNIEYVSSARNYSDGASTNSVTISAPSSISENNLLLAWVIREGDHTSDASCSGWTLYRQDYYTNLAVALLYKWATASEPGDYTFSHGDSSYGGMGGAILNFSGSILKSHSPIYKKSVFHSYAYFGSAYFGWNTEELNVDVSGAIVVVLGAGYRSPIGSATLIAMFAESVNNYTDLFGTTPIGGYSSTTGNCVGGGVGYQKFASPGVALDGGAGVETPGTSGGIVGVFGATGQWYHVSQLVMLI